MGYTHGWHRGNLKNHGQKTWDKFILDCKKLYKNMPKYTTSAGGCYAESPLIINGCGRYKYAAFNKNIIWFNGTNGTNRKKDEDGDWETINKVGVDTLSHETFILSRKPINLGNFCKTARKPYDLMVTACLLLYSYYFRNVVVDSDGTEEDWSEAFKFIASVLGKSLALELKMENLIKYTKRRVI